MFLFCLVFAMICVRLFICALWSPSGKGLTSWLSFVVSTVTVFCVSSTRYSWLLYGLWLGHFLVIFTYFMNFSNILESLSLDVEYFIHQIWTYDDFVLTILLIGQDLS